MTVARTAWLDPFFTHFAATDTNALLRGVGAFSVDLDGVQGLVDFEQSMSGWLYWSMFLRGFLDMQRVGRLAPDNPYLLYLSLLYRQHQHDPGLGSDMLTQASASARIQMRYNDLDHALANGPSTLGLEPVTVVVRTPPGRGGHSLHLATSGRIIDASMLDGYHRIFCARLAGWSLYPATIITEASPLPILPGEIGECGEWGQRIRVTGWLRAGRRAVTSVELRHGSTTLCVAAPHQGFTRGKDGTTYFDLDVRLAHPLEQVATLRVVPHSDFMRPLGCLVARD